MTSARRSFLKLATGAAAFGALPLALLRTRSAAASSPCGPLLEDPDGILDLPKGFSYRILETAGEDMDDGYLVPGRPDGMGCFELADGNLALMRNHELNPGSWSLGAYGAKDEPPQAYHAGSLGGVTRLVVDPVEFSRVSSNLVLTGTNRNCAGGWSPWGWLSCEENLATGHGYVFVCDAEADGLREPDVKKMYGRFNHEAAAVHPETLVCYLTEDNGIGCFYRFAPDHFEHPFEGRLQALRVIDSPMFHTTSMNVGDVVDIDWVDIADPDAGGSLHVEAQSKGAAIFVRGEGLAISGDDIWICATSGGPVAKGQVFRLRDGVSVGKLELVVQSTDAAALDMPDNICVAPSGEVYMAEDGGSVQFIRFIDSGGHVRDFARNAKSASEFAGVCFSPDGSAMFVNMQVDGLTLVVTGPFGDMGRGAADCEDTEGDSGGTGAEVDTGTDAAAETGSGTVGEGAQPTASSDGTDDGDTRDSVVFDDVGHEESDLVLSSSCACSADTSSPGVGATLASAVAAAVYRRGGRGSAASEDDV